MKRKSYESPIRQLTYTERVFLVELGEELIDILARCVEVVEEFAAHERKFFTKRIQDHIQWAAGAIHSLQFVLERADAIELATYVQYRDGAMIARRDIVRDIKKYYEILNKGE